MYKHAPSLFVLYLRKFGGDHDLGKLGGDRCYSAPGACVPGVVWVDLGGMQEVPLMHDPRARFLLVKYIRRSAGAARWPFSTCRTRRADGGVCRVFGRGMRRHEPSVNDGPLAHRGAGHRQEPAAGRVLPFRPCERYHHTAGWCIASRGHAAVSAISGGAWRVPSRSAGGPFARTDWASGHQPGHLVAGDSKPPGHIAYTLPPWTRAGALSTLRGCVGIPGQNRNPKSACPLL